MKKIEVERATLYIRVPKTTKDRLDKVCEQKGITINRLCTVLLEASLDELEASREHV